MRNPPGFRTSSGRGCGPCPRSEKTRKSAQRIFSRLHDGRGDPWPLARLATIKRTRATTERGLNTGCRAQPCPLAGAATANALILRCRRHGRPDGLLELFLCHSRAENPGSYLARSSGES